MVSAREDSDAMRIAAIETMLASIAGGGSRTFYVSLAGYYIEGAPYPASGLTVNAEATPDLHRTRAGFGCTAFFPPNVLTRDIVDLKGTVTRQFDDETVVLVPVHLEVELIDVWGVAEFIDGAQCDLFQDRETLRTRFRAFGS